MPTNASESHGEITPGLNLGKWLDLLTLMPQTVALLPKDVRRSSCFNHGLDGLSAAFCLTVSGNLDDQNEDAGEEQHRNPPHRLDQPENKPREYQSYAEPPQHQGISFSL